MTHLKRLAASKQFPIARKVNKFTIVPSPGPHAKEECIPLGILVRDVLHLAKDARETKKIVSSGSIIIDGKIRRDHRHPVGIMDVVEIPKIKKQFRMIAKEGKLRLVEIDENKAKMKICKITGKRLVESGRLQLNFHDGRNIVTDEKSYSTGDTLVLSLPDQKIKDHFKLEKGNIALVTGGKHVGLVGKIAGLVTMRGIESNKAVVEADGNQYTTLRDYVFVIGKDKPLITLE